MHGWVQNKPRDFSIVGCYTVLRRITSFRSTTDRVYDGCPITLLYYIILYYIILYYMILYYSTYHCVTIAYSIHYSKMLYRFVASEQ
jgi:hypothetical protein